MWTQHDQLVVALDLIERPAEDPGWVFGITGEELLVCTRHPTRRALEALPVRVIARPAQQGADRRLGFLSGRLHIARWRLRRRLM
jgi:hypothetical protein